MTTLHEIGHAVGLLHEYQRANRDDHMMIPDWWASATQPVKFDKYSVRSEWLFDYRSVMHTSEWGEESIPPGIPIAPSANERLLSDGDIIGVNRLYGKPPQATHVTTNPPGLEVVVDGFRVSTPATFYWMPDSSHVLEAPLWQEHPDDLGQVAYVYGKWNDGADRIRNFSANPAQGWIEANYILRWASQARSSTVFEDQIDEFDATPRALTFISDPAVGMSDSATEVGAQSVRLTNRQESTESYSIASDRPWLVATPTEVTLAPGASADIEVRVLRASLQSGMYQGNLKVGPTDMDPSSLPVAFAVLPQQTQMRLGNSGGILDVAVSRTEGFLDKRGRSLFKGGQVIAPNGSAYSVPTGTAGLVANFQPRTQSVDLDGRGSSRYRDELGGRDMADR